MDLTNATQYIEGQTFTVYVIGRLWMPNAKATTVYKGRVSKPDEWLADSIPVNILLANPEDAIADWLTTHSGDFSEVIAWEATVVWSEPCRFVRDDHEGMGRRSQTWASENYEDESLTLENESED